MDFQNLIDSFAVASAVLSVEKTPEGLCGAIHIVCANRQYKSAMGPAYYDGMPYQELVPQDPKFEDFCFRAAHGRQRMHAYVETKALGCWTDQLMIPLEGGGEDLRYCQFIFEFTRSADPARMAAVSIDNASAVIKACITLMGTDNFLSRVEQVLSDIVEQTGAYSCRIMLIDHDRRDAIIFCEKQGKVSFPYGPMAEDGTVLDGSIPYEIVSTWEAMIGSSNAVIVKDARDMELLARRNAPWVETMRQYHVESLILIPLRREQAVFGYLYVVNFDTERVVQSKELLELMSFFLGSEISNHLLMTRLEELSSVDGLTGLFNRNAMIRKLKDLRRGGVPFGVVNLDLNGLKRVNDTQGHDAGDRLLVRAAEALQKFFYQEDLYRTGGDEFIVIATGIPREAFDRKLARLRAEALGDGLSFAMGCCWSEGGGDPSVAFRRADENMYADKKAYYDRHPNLRRGE